METRAPFTPPTLQGEAYLHEGLGLQSAHRLYQAVAELQVLLQGQRVDGQEGHVRLWGRGRQSQGWDRRPRGSPAASPAPSAALAEMGNPFPLAHL